MQTSRLDKIIAQLEQAAELGLDPDVAWFLEDCADAMHEAARAAAIAPLLLRPANDSTPEDPDGPMERVARSRGLRIASVSWLDATRYALWVDALSAIFVCDCLSAIERLLALAHEVGHARLPRAPHAEIGYLALALLCPRSLLAELPYSRQITGLAVLQAAPWRLPLRAAEARARLLRRAEQAA